MEEYGIKSSIGSETNDIQVNPKVRSVKGLTISVSPYLYDERIHIFDKK